MPNALRYRAGRYSVRFWGRVFAYPLQLACPFGAEAHPSTPVGKAAGALVGGGVLSAIALVQGLRAPVVQNYEVQLAGLPASSDGTVLILASKSDQFVDVGFSSSVTVNLISALIKMCSVTR